MPSENPWPDEHVELLRKLCNQGSHTWVSFKMQELTGERRYTRNAIIGKLNRLGLISNFKGPRAKKIKDQKVKIVQKKGTHTAPVFVEQQLPTIAPSEFLAISIIDLERQHCRYIRGEGAEATYCGQDKMPNSSYCERCYKICYVKPGIQKKSPG